MVRVRVPASTSNLGSGFDTLGLALKLYLTVEMEASSSLQIESRGQDAVHIPANDSNLTYRAAKKLFQHLGKPTPSLKIVSANQIPLARGLGSSGAAIIAGLVCATKLSGTNLSEEDILVLANEIEDHPENAAASLYGGLTINCLDNKNIISKKISVERKLKAVLLIPEINIATEEARAILPNSIPHRDAVYNIQRCALLVQAFLQKDYGSLRVAMQDKLHQTYRKRLIPGFDQFEKAAYENGALGTSISGSGSTILSFTLENGNRLKGCWQETAHALNLRARVLITEIENSGARLM